MTEGLEVAIRAAAIGVGGTAVLDLWNAGLKRRFGISSLSMELLGRWMGYFLRGRFAHDNIAESAPLPGERVVGWAAHYAIGITWAALLLGMWGLDWARRPTPLPAIIVGLATLVAPFLFMQPGMGLGIFASKTPRPNAARLKSVVSHTVYGVGLYGSAVLSAFVVQLWQ